MSHVWKLLRTSVTNWNDDQIPRRAAALAYYAAFSLAPLLLIGIGIGSFVFGADAMRGHVVQQLRGLLGKEAALAVETALKNTRLNGSSLPATLVGLFTLLVGASGVFGELQESLNEIWKVPREKSRGWKHALLHRFRSFTLVLGTGFLLLVSLLLNAALEASITWVVGSTDETVAAKWVGIVVSFVAIATLFALIFKVLPDARTRWRDVWLGASITALLFSIGKTLIGLYIGHSALSSTYGAAGSFVVLLLWLYYSCQVVFMGAEFTHVYAVLFGEPPTAKDPSEPRRRRKGRTEATVASR